MKSQKLLFIIPIVLIINTAYGQEASLKKFKKLEWLVGKWTRTNAKPGQSGYESWTKASDSKLIGKGVTLKGKETIFVENLKFIIKGNDIFYVVTITDEKQPTYFKLTEVSTDGFTCENPDHDFPKKIAYHKNGKKVKAVISGNGQSMDYNFVATP